VIKANLQKAPEESRGEVRRSVRLQASAETVGGHSQTAVEIRDLSSTGFLMATGARLTIGELINVEIGGNELKAKVIWKSGRSVGCEFVKPLTKAQRSAALLRGRPLSGSTAPQGQPHLRRVQLRLAAMTEELNLLEKQVLASALQPDAHSDPAAAGAQSERVGAQPVERLPLAVRGWAIVLLSLVLWCALLWVFRNL
jgi:hypothetical protein